MARLRAQTQAQAQSLGRRGQVSVDDVGAFRAAGQRLDKNGSLEITPQKLGPKVDILQTEFGQGVVFEFVELETIALAESDVPVQADADVFEFSVYDSVQRGDRINVVLYR